jgi:hypothetical protein
MNDLIERIRQIIDHHGENDRAEDAGRTCGCGATRLSDHSRHVAEEIVKRLGLRAEYVDHVGKEVRYVTALFDDELTKLEGAE